MRPKPNKPIIEISVGKVTQLIKLLAFVIVLSFVSELCHSICILSLLEEPTHLIFLTYKKYKISKTSLK